MKLLPILVCAAAVCGVLSACDSTASKTETKTVIDTIYTDRFAQDKAVVWGEWTVSTATDTADAVFLQDASSITAFIYWKSGTWKLTGTVFDSTLALMSTSPMVMFNGGFPKSSAAKVAKMTGTSLAQGSTSAANWTAVRIR